MILPPVLVLLRPPLGQTLVLPLVFAMYWLFPATIVVLGASYLRAGYRTAEPKQQRQILWLVNACVIMGVIWAAQVVAYPFGQLWGWSGARTLLWGSYAATPLIFNACLLLAVFYDGAIDPAFVIRRTTVFGILGVICVFLLAGLGNVVSEMVEERLGLPGVVGSGIYGGVVAILLLPLRRRFERITERWMPDYRTEYRARG